MISLQRGFKNGPWNGVTQEQIVALRAEDDYTAAYPSTASYPP